MGKSNGKMDYNNQFVEGALQAGKLPVTQEQFADEMAKVKWLNEMLSQQIISLDVTMGLLIERVARNFEVAANEDGVSSTMKITPWTQEQFNEFKQEVQVRVQKVAKQIADNNKQLQKQVIA